MKQYQDLAKYILEHGVEKADRTGTGTLSVFGYQMRFNLQEGFPLLTTKEMYKNDGEHSRFDDIVEELLWFLRGDTNAKNLAIKGINIWNRDAYKQYLRISALRGEEQLTYQAFVMQLQADGMFAKEYGDLGNIYGYQWRSWGETDGGGSVDQISEVMKRIKENPDDRGLIVSAWNALDIHKGLMALRPCHTMFQFYVHNDTLSCQLYQRSMDVFLGGGYNIASYSLLTMMMAQCLGLAPGEFVHTVGDAHIYLNHVEQMKEQVKREPKPLPLLHINPFKKGIFTFDRSDFVLEGYTSHPELKGKQSF